MINKERISRQERRHPYTPAKIFLISILSVFLLGIIGYTIIKPDKPAPAPTQKTDQRPNINIPALGDSIIESCSRSFILTENLVATHRSTPAGGNAVSFSYYSLEWPDELPFIVFAERLSRYAAERELSCECRESEKGNWAECNLRYGSTPAASIRLNGSRKARLAGREAAFLLDNFGTLKGEDVIYLIRSGYTFAYISTPDIYPSADVRKLMARANITTILNLPTTKSEWLSLANIMGMGRKSGKKKAAPAFNSALVDDILSRQPDARLFTYKWSSKPENDVISLVAERASKKKMSFIPIGDSRNKLESLGISLKVKKMEYAPGMEISGVSFADLKLKLYNKLLLPDSNSQRLIIRPDLAKISREGLVNLRVSLDRLGVKTRPFMKLLESTDDL